ncbi:MAG: YraN family protein [Victivallales bacterium]|nr:YraN family protein [Victivallales bacterium]
MRAPFHLLRARHLRLGRRGEDLACRLLRGEGCDILCRNYRVRAGEIDIVARDGGILTFVEVKTRYVTTVARPAAGLNPRQELRIMAAARRYRQRIGNPRSPYRFDLIEVRLGRWGVVELRHWPDHFSAATLRYYRRAMREQ